MNQPKDGSNPTELVPVTATTEEQELWQLCATGPAPIGKETVTEPEPFTRIAPLKESGF